MHAEFRQRALDLLMMDREPMALDAFWELVDAVAWRDPAAPHEERLAAAGLRDVVLAYLRLSELYVALDERLAAWNGGLLRRELDAVAFSDLVFHLIGLGRAEHDAAFADPGGAQRPGVRESFSFVFTRAFDRFSDDAVRSALVAAYVPRPWIDGEWWEKNTLVRHEEWGLGIIDLSARDGVRVIFEGKPRILPGSKAKRG